MKSSIFQRLLPPGLVFQSGVVARGYGTLTCLFVAVYVLPVATIGVWSILRTPDGAGSVD